MCASLARSREGFVFRSLSSEVTPTLTEYFALVDILGEMTIFTEELKYNSYVIFILVRLYMSCLLAFLSF